jgi:hypothetical protein
VLPGAPLSKNSTIQSDFRPNLKLSFSDTCVITKDFFHINYLRCIPILKMKSGNKESSKLSTRTSNITNIRFRKEMNQKGSNKLGVEFLCSINRCDYF